MSGNGKTIPHLFVIMGGTGDLSMRKLVPALYHGIEEGSPEHHCVVLGVARNSGITEQEYRETVRSALIGSGIDDPASWCDSCVFYQPIGEGNEEDYRRLSDRIDRIEKEKSIPGRRVFYLALPPGAVKPVIEKLGGCGLNRSESWTRIVIEKPFGRDLDSARELNSLLHKWYEESQIFRIDHYLGKETVQNLLVFRFANSIFESMWRREFVSCVQITVAESLGVENRAGYYDQSGAVRDMIQNHLSQLITLIAMEVPSALEAEPIRYEKIKVLKSIRPLDPSWGVLGQYGSGVTGGEKVPAYTEEKGVADDSNTETYAAMRLDLDTWRWHGVPFFIRTGKRLPTRCTEIAVVFEKPPVCLFLPYRQCQLRSNVLLITLQPNEGFTLSFDVKVPGKSFRFDKQKMTFKYEDKFGRMPDAYETLLLDIVTGDQTLFVHAEEVEEAWKIYMPLIEKDLPVHRYQAGSWGPEQSGTLLSEQGYYWYSAHEESGKSGG
ncbi:MAG: glucose-6-phosphate dehydrogenase [Candidatus Krumholzibacteriales bacterium]